MKIVVIQRHVENLWDIKDSVAGLNATRAESIFYTSDPEEALKAVENAGPALVISGLVLDSSDRSRPPLWDGTDLAREIKSANPEALFFIYSIFSNSARRNEAVDGFILKPSGISHTGDHSTLVEILVSDLENATTETLRAAFPAITP